MGGLPLRTFILFVTLNLLNYLDRYLVYGLVPELMRHFSLTKAEAGQLVSAFVFGYFVCSPFFGMLGDRLPRGPLMALGVLLWSIATGLSGLAVTFIGFFCARLCVGVGEAAFGTISPGYLKDSIADPVKVNRAFAIFFAAIPVGSALGYVLAGVAVQHFSWHYAFYVGAIPGIILFAFLLKVPEKRSHAPSSINFKAGIREIIRIPLLWFAIIGYVLNCFALNGIAAFVTDYGEQIGFKLEDISITFGKILAITGLLGTFGGGWLASWLCSQARIREQLMLRFVGVAALLGFPCAYFAFGFTDHMSFLIACTFAELLIFAGTAPINAVIVLVCPAAYVTLTQGLTIFCLNLFGTLLAPLVTGYIADSFGLTVSLRVAACALLASGIVWFVGGCIRFKSSVTVQKISRPQ